jgi:hypothetical protein
VLRDLPETEVAVQARPAVREDVLDRDSTLASERRGNGTRDSSRDRFELRRGLGLDSGSGLLGRVGLALSGSVAGVVRLFGEGRTLSGATSLIGWIEAQLGEDPRTYGRGGIGPTPTQLDATIGIPTSAGTLDRLFLGPEQAHFSGELVFEQWILPELAIDAGVFGRLPLGAEAKRSHQPATIEAWVGPTLLLASGIRTAIAARFAFEDPGESERLFAARGHRPQILLRARVRRRPPGQVALADENRALRAHDDVTGSEIRHPVQIRGGVRHGTHPRVAIRRSPHGAGVAHRDKPLRPAGDRFQIGTAEAKPAQICI